MLVKRPNSRPIPEATKERQDWLKNLQPGDLVYCGDTSNPVLRLTKLKNLQPGDLVHYCNGGYWDLHPIFIVVRSNSTTILTRSIEDLIWKPNVSAMKRVISSDRELELPWSNEDGSGLCKWRTHNFILPTEANSLSLWIQQDKEWTTPHLYSSPNLNAFDALRLWLRRSHN